MTLTVNREKLNASLRMLDKMGEMNLEQLKETDPAQAKQLEKLGTLFTNESFCKQFAVCSEKQELARLFADNGLPLAEEEAQALKEFIYTIARKLVENDGELGEDDLEQIVGGAWLGGIAGAICGALLGAAIGFVFGAPGVGVAVGVVIGILIGGFGTDV